MNPKSLIRIQWNHGKQHLTKCLMQSNITEVDEEIQPIEVSDQQRRKKRRRIIFWSVNIIGLLLAIPLLKVTWPLLEIVWKTRSSQAIESNAEFQENGDGSIKRQFEQASQQAAADPQASINELSSKLEGLENLDEQELDKWADRIFGSGNPPEDPDTFDLDSAVFSRIEREIADIEGQQTYVYWIELVDESGNKAYRVATSPEPDPDYERSIMTLQLVRENPELQKIYNAFSHAMAKQGASSNEDSDQKDGKK